MFLNSSAFFLSNQDKEIRGPGSMYISGPLIIFQLSTNHLSQIYFLTIYSSHCFILRAKVGFSLPYYAFIITYLGIDVKENHGLFWLS